MERRRRRQSFGGRRWAALLSLVVLLFESLTAVGYAGIAGRTGGDAEDGPLTYLEICTPLGIQRISLDGQPLEEEDEETDGQSPPSAARAPCLICNAFTADAIVCPGLHEIVAWPAATLPDLLRDQEIVVAHWRCRPKLSRAPPREI